MTFWFIKYYEDMLEIWGISSLEKSRARGDLIQTCKIVNGLESIEWYSRLQFVSGWRTAQEQQQATRSG